MMSGLCHAPSQIVINYCGVAIKPKDTGADMGFKNGDLLHVIKKK
jgi:hypothetical protein